MQGGEFGSFAAFFTEDVVYLLGHVLNFSLLRVL